MDLMQILAGIPGIGQFLPYLLAAGAVSAAVATVLPPPKADGSKAYGLFYTAVNWAALNLGRARNATAPIPPPIKQ